MTKKLLFAISLGLSVTSMTSYYANAAEAANTIDVSLLKQSCLPMAINTHPGNIHFVVTNRTDKAASWGILNAGQVVAIQESIPPNAHQELMLHLDPGQYAILCGAKDNPHGQLTVQLPQAKPDKPFEPSAQDIADLGKRYQGYLAGQGQLLEKQSQKWDGGEVALDFAVSYYAMLPFASVYQGVPKEDRLGGDANNIEALRQQISQLKEQSSKQALSFAQDLQALQQGLSQQANAGAQWQGLAQDVKTFVQTATPLMNRLDKATLDATMSHIQTWLKGDNPNIRQKLRADLAHIGEALKLKKPEEKQKEEKAKADDNAPQKDDSAASDSDQSKTDATATDTSSDTQSSNDKSQSKTDESSKNEGQ
ncbi:cupredoxin domain-containing protein [Celerinatantimonas sp. MCCC 1A17872]|uniref:cupredoxin domain-containing protein n=1 Tax=Celerinatantimonas sp. MCCC 1A17872 TaxID=3177514 RepID=UPI0038C21915